jgi:hypothetical protein
MGFPDERGIGMSECVPLFLGGFSAQAEPIMKILLLVSPLVRDVRRIVNHYVKKAVLERCGCVVCDNRRLMLRFVVDPNDAASAAAPKSTTIHCGVQNPAGFFPRIHFQHPFEQFGVLASPY